MLGENIQCFITKKDISCELLTDDFYQVEEFFFYPLLADSFIITGCWSLSNTIGMIICFAFSLLIW